MLSPATGTEESVGTSLVTSIRVSPFGLGGVTRDNFILVGLHLSERNIELGDEHVRVVNGG